MFKLSVNCLLLRLNLQTAIALTNSKPLFLFPAGSLRRHSLNHTEEKNFLCPYCKKSFKSVVNCRKHIKTHKNEIITQVKYNKQIFKIIKSYLKNNSKVTATKTRRNNTRKSTERNFRFNSNGSNSNARIIFSIK